MRQGKHQMRGAAAQALAEAPDAPCRVVRPAQFASKGASWLQRTPDERLLLLAAGGDAGAFEAFFLRHIDSAFSLASRICRDRAVAEEVVQESFLGLWRSSPDFDPARSSARTWAFSVVHHRAIDALRRSAVRERGRIGAEGLIEMVEAPERTDDQVVQVLQARQMQVAVTRLPPAQREVIELSFFEGYAHREIASALGLPLGTVKGRMRLALDRLRAPDQSSRPSC